MNVSKNHSKNIGAILRPLCGHFYLFLGQLLTFHWCRWGAEQRVKHAQTQERGPPSAPAEFYNNLEFILQSTIVPQIYNLQYTGKTWLKSTIFAQKQKCSLQIYKILARKICSLQGFFSRIYSLQLDSPPLPPPIIRIDKNYFFTFA